jgi:diguanylate cyclase
VLSTGVREQVEFTIPRLDGTIYFIGRLEAVPKASGPGRNAVALVRDVTDLMREEAQRQVMAQTLNLLEEAIVDLSPDGFLTSTSLAWATLRGYSAASKRSEDHGKRLVDLANAEDTKALTQALASVAETGVQVTQRFRLVRQTVDLMWVEARLIAVRDMDGKVVTVRGVIRDVTVAYMNERHIMQLALYDGLTGLPNRVMLDDLLHQAIARANRNNTKVAMGFIDLDHFKQINDTFGHDAGDRTLTAVARQLKSVLREEDTLARWGGDEFVVLIPDIADTSTLGFITERLREMARQGIVLDGIETRPSISIGIAIYPDNANTGKELMMAADSTMYHAKSAGRNNVQFYNDIVHLKGLSREHMAVQNRLSSAVLANDMQVYYQPIVNSRTGEVCSVEALVRWHDEAGGWINPGVFIPMAEKLGLIQELSEQVMVQSLGRLQHWRKKGLKQTLAVNVSRNLLFSPRLLDDLLGLTKQYDLRPCDITVEITETLALTDYGRQSKQLRELRNAGFIIAIDDFGTGYSSLSQLHDMPIDLLKVDITFTARLNTESGRRIMQAIVQMGLGLGLEIVVEGVESIEVVRFLQGLGVIKMQGFYFSKAVPAGICELIMLSGVKEKL